MAKRIRRDTQLYIAPDILGYYNRDDIPEAFDERKNEVLNPDDIDDKITIYERQVKKWFLHRATRLIRGDKNGFIVLMICLSYLEGVEQYRRGETSNGRSGEFFRFAVQRIYPGQFSDDNIDNLYREARCGLFHNGMVREAIIISRNFINPIFFDHGYNIIKINPKILLNNIKNDFDSYIKDLKNKENKELRNNFDAMFTNLEEE